MAKEFMATRVVEMMWRAVHNRTTSYQTDLLRDIETLTKYKPNEFAWCATECGTKLIIPDKYVPESFQCLNQTDAIVKLTYHSEETWYLFTNVFEENGDWEDNLYFGGKNDAVSIWRKLNSITE
jgi:CTP:phosphocholine cytidylyltransferase-like protein